MRTLREILTAQRTDMSRQWTKKFLKINALCGIALGIALFTPDCMADTWLDVNVASKHIGLEGMRTKQGYREFNEKNYGLGLSFQHGGNVEYSVGFYDNSFNTTTMYLGVDLHTRSTDNFRAGISLGVVSGYGDYLDQPPVTVMPNVVYAFGSEQVFRVKVGFIPALNGIATLQVGVKF